MGEDASVSHWLDGLRAGDGADIERLWDRYFLRLVALARGKLSSPQPPRVRRGGRRTERIPQLLRACRPR